MQTSLTRSYGYLEEGDMQLTRRQQQTHNISQNSEDEHDNNQPIRPLEERRSGCIRLVVTVLLMLALFVVIVDSMGERHIESAILNFLTWVELHPNQGILAVIGVYILATILFVPGSILTFGAAYAFGSAYQNKVHGVIIASTVC